MKETKYLVVILLVVFVATLTVGCGSKNSSPLSTKEVAALREWHNLPENTRITLMADELSGLKVANTSSCPESGRVLQVFLENGAHRSSKKDADFVISSKINGLSTRVIITDKFGSTFQRNLNGEVDAIEFGLSVATSLGTERKTAILSEAQAPTK